MHLSRLYCTRPGLSNLTHSSTLASQRKRERKKKPTTEGITAVLDWFLMNFGTRFLFLTRVFMYFQWCMHEMLRHPLLLNDEKFSFRFLVSLGVPLELCSSKCSMLVLAGKE